MQPLVKYSFRRVDKNQQLLFPTIKGKSLKKMPHKRDREGTFDLTYEIIRDEEQFFKKISRIRHNFFERKRKDKYLTIHDESSVEEKLAKPSQSIDKKKDKDRSPSRVILRLDETQGKEIKNHSFLKRGKNSRKNINISKDRTKTLKTIQSQFTYVPRVRFVIKNKTPEKKSSRYLISEEVVQKLERKEQTVRHITSEQKNSILEMLKEQRKKKREKMEAKTEEEEDYNLEGWKLSEIKQNQFE